ncbi:MAG: ABC transporter permease [Candidatus Rokubacteria bacterium]|nr:ABC transporter permease [Candidatus Rokubacteria bacterium]
MAAYIVRRLIWAAPVALLVSVITFSLLYLIPGDPAVMVLGEQATPDMVRDFRARFDLDKPYAARFVTWAGRVARGDLGRSWRTNETVAGMILAQLPVTVELTVLALLVGLAIGIPTGIVAAVRPHSRVGVLATVGAVFGLAMPYFFLGILLIYLFAYSLRLLPPAGFVPLTQDVLGNLRSMTLPSVALGAQMGAIIMRQTRSSMLDVIGQDYIRSARAKGLWEPVVLVRHALKNALIPVVTVAGLQTGRLFGGAVITETLFALPGLGRLVVNGVALRDYLVVQGVVLLMAVVVLLTNLAVDVLYGYLDPRIRQAA